MNHANPSTSDDEEIDSDDANDVYEYEEAVPEEESSKNRRYDPVENFEYELPQQFEVGLFLWFNLGLLYLCLVVERAEGKKRKKYMTSNLVDCFVYLGPSN